jgi:hypothetical protein
MRARHFSIALAALSGALAIAACGSSGKTGTNAGADPLLKLARCMRAHGVPNFPDPSPNGGGVNIGPSSGFNPQSPAFQAAQQSCRHLLPGGGPPRPVPESIKLSLLKHAECMREHGVPNYPDPTFPGGGGVANLLPSDVNPSSPAFQRAAKACQGP